MKRLQNHKQTGSQRCPAYPDLTRLPSNILLGVHLGKRLNLISNKFVAVSLLLIVSVASLINLIGSEQERSFRLKFSGMSQLSLQKIEVKLSDEVQRFEVDSSKWDSIGGYTLVVSTSVERGQAELILYTSVGAKLSLSNMEFKLGETNYITHHDGTLQSVKAHWQ